MGDMDQTTITGTANYTSYRVPAGGKGERVTRAVQMKVPIPRATFLQAPVAAHVPQGGSLSPITTLEIRTHDGALYRQLLDDFRKPVAPGHRNLRTYFGEHCTALDAREAIRAALGKLLLVDGSLWERIPEPVIEVGQSSTRVIPGPSDRGAWQVFAITEYDAAVSAGKVMDVVEATYGRGPRKPLPPVEVFIPSVFTMTTSAERVARSREIAANETSRARRILDTGSAQAMNRASRILMKAANELARQTGETAYSEVD